MIGLTKPTCVWQCLVGTMCGVIVMLDAECAAAIKSQKGTSDNIIGRTPCLGDQSWPTAMTFWWVVAKPHSPRLRKGNVSFVLQGPVRHASHAPVSGAKASSMSKQVKSAKRLLEHSSKNAIKVNSVNHWKTRTICQGIGCFQQVWWLPFFGPLPRIRYRPSIGSISFWRTRPLNFSPSAYVQQLDAGPHMNIQRPLSALSGLIQPSAASKWNTKIGSSRHSHVLQG